MNAREVPDDVSKAFILGALGILIGSEGVITVDAWNAAIAMAEEYRDENRS